ncbi:lipocalin-like domain-containing protein [Serratia sp. JSRIV002]|nr:lipocalin-like domain-containing protein [Serratia sp. JSRIV002]
MSLLAVGHYRIDEDKQCVIHRVEGGSFPNWLGSQQIRFYSFTGETLTLRTVPLQLDNRVQIGELVWQRLQAAEGEKS